MDTGRDEGRAEDRTDRPRDQWTRRVCLCLFIPSARLQFDCFNSHSDQLCKHKRIGMRYFNENLNIWRRFMLTERNKCDFHFVFHLYAVT